MRERKEPKFSPFEKQWVDWCNQYPTAKKMLDRVSEKPKTLGSYGRGVKLLSEFLQKNPDEIVNEYIADVKVSQFDGFDKWEGLMTDFIKFLKKKGFQSGTYALYFSGAKNLLNFNVPKSMRLQTETPKVTCRQIPPISLEELKKVYSMSDTRERCFISILKDSGISLDDVVLLTLRDLENFSDTAQFCHIAITRGKENVRYGTFLGPNALDDLRAYLRLRQQAGEMITPETPLFSTMQRPFRPLTAEALAAIFKAVTKRTGIPISSHRLRKFFETYVALVARHPIIVKFWTGHKIGSDVESHYVIPPVPEQLKLYQEAYKNLDLTGGSIEQRAREAARTEFEKMLSPEQREFLSKHPIEFRQKAKKESTKDCSDGAHCQKIVTEQELSQLLQEGAKVVATLSSGKIVVEF